MATLKRLLVGRAKRTEQAIHERLSKKTGLAVFASDALSSTAYASEEILLVLAVAAVAGQTYAFHYVVPISVLIAMVLGIVATSYRQTIHALPFGRWRLYRREGKFGHYARTGGSGCVIGGLHPNSLGVTGRRRRSNNLSRAGNTLRMAR